MPSEINEKIHNRHITCIVASAGNDCSGLKDHGQRLGPPWSADQDQRPEASSSKPQDSRISYKLQAASFKLDKLQAVGYNRIMLIKKPQTDKKDPFGFDKAINWDKLNDPKVLNELEKLLEEEDEKKNKK